MTTPPGQEEIPGRPDPQGHNESEPRGKSTDLVAHYERHAAGGGSVSHGALEELCALARRGLEADELREDLAKAIRQRNEVTDKLNARFGSYIDVVFDGPPGPEAGRFVEVEDETGHSVKVGEWIESRTGDLWRLRIPMTKSAVAAGESPSQLAARMRAEFQAGPGAAGESWLEVTRNLSERVARLEAVSGLIGRREAAVAAADHAVYGGPVDMGQLCPETGVYVSRCTHCGAEPIGGEVAAPAGKPPTFADIGKSPAFQRVATDGIMRDFVRTDRYLKVADGMKVVPLQPPPLEQTETSPEPIATYAITRDHLIALLEDAWHGGRHHGVSFPTSDIGARNTASLERAAELANRVEGQQAPPQQTDGTTITIAVDHWQRVWSPLIGAAPPLDLEACVARLVEQNEAGEREAAETVASLKLRLRQAIRHLELRHLKPGTGGSAPGGTGMRARPEDMIITAYDDGSRDPGRFTADLADALESDRKIASGLGPFGLKGYDRDEGPGASEQILQHVIVAAIGAVAGWTAGNFEIRHLAETRDTPPRSALLVFAGTARHIGGVQPVLAYVELGQLHLITLAEERRVVGCGDYEALWSPFLQRATSAGYAVRYCWPDRIRAALAAGKA